MNLEASDLCLDCGEVFDGERYAVCPKCGGGRTLPLLAWIPPVCSAAERAQAQEAGA